MYIYIAMNNKQASIIILTGNTDCVSSNNRVNWRYVGLRCSV